MILPSFPLLSIPRVPIVSRWAVNCWFPSALLISQHDKFLKYEAILCWAFVQSRPNFIYVNEAKYTPQIYASINRHCINKLSGCLNEDKNKQIATRKKQQLFNRPTVWNLFFFPAFNQAVESFLLPKISYGSWMGAKSCFKSRVYRGQRESISATCRYKRR